MPNADIKQKKYKTAGMSPVSLSIVAHCVATQPVTHKVGSNDIWNNTDCFLTHWMDRADSLEIVTFRQMNRTLAVMLAVELVPKHTSLIYLCYMRTPDH